MGQHACCAKAQSVRKAARGFFVDSHSLRQLFANAAIAPSRVGS
jgi:hypothetical protein